MDDPLKEGQDYLIDDAGRYVFTREFLLSRGECCGSGCRHCPYSDPSTVANVGISEKSQLFDAPKTQL